MFRNRLVAWASLVVLGSAAHGATADLPEVGQTPPPLTVDAWVKGKPVESFDTGVVYLVEFWGTWCGPCIQSIPHLNDLQKRYRDQNFVIIGVASHEFKGGIELVEEFVADRGDSMDYRIAFDGDLSVERDWQTGGDPDVVFKMPEGYLIDRSGRIVWIGHPAGGSMDEAIRRAVQGQGRQGAKSPDSD